MGKELKVGSLKILIIPLLLLLTTCVGGNRGEEMLKYAKGQHFRTCVDIAYDVFYKDYEEKIAYKLAEEWCEN